MEPDHVPEIAVRIALEENISSNTAPYCERKGPERVRMRQHRRFDCTLCNTVRPAHRLPRASGTEGLNKGIALTVETRRVAR